ncbi:MAG: LacI family DNA-binding transcriptional regulator [Burkholderiales bacterium]|nr:LacI family DNA-binding transcriptional regulator [Burkholderiales bacterium]
MSHTARETIHDVARRAKVSAATVSRVLNESATVAPGTVARVRRAVQALDFRPNLAGRSLRAARTRSLGVVVPTLANPVFAECLAGVEAGARAHGHTLSLATTGYKAAAEADAVEALLRQRVDGLVLTVTDAARNRVLDRLDRERVPYVLVFNQLARAERPTVSVDNRAAAREIVEHLIGLGHRAIRMLTGQFRQSDRARLRYRGYCDALQAAGLEPLPPLQMPFLAPDARLPLVEGLAARPRPTAFFCSNDYLALTVIRDLTALGRRVPDDVSVAGFDGIRIGELTAPSLTTVVQPSERIGGAAVELLLRRVVDTGEVASVALQHTLRRGGSTAAVAANPRAGRALAVLS